MRKQFKQKKSACKMCKPHKMHLVNRWSAKDQSLSKAHQKEIQKELDK